MEQSAERLNVLMRLYFDQQISESEKLELWDYVADPAFADQVQALIPDSTSQAVEAPGLNPSAEKRILNHIFDYSNIKALPSKTVKLWPRIAIAVAVAIIIVSAGIWFYGKKEIVDNGIAYQSDVAPGKMGATLTLANGRKVRLADAASGEIANEAGISVTKTADGQLVYKIKKSSANPDKVNTLTTARGETYILTLPDNSSVWMNAASSLTYAANLTDAKGQRKVKLEGEAYFQVAKDKAHPFIVETKGQQVEVLGTQFNINSYADEAVTRTTLLEGSIRLLSLGNKTILKPNQQAILSENQLNVREVNTEEAVAWKSGLFLFEEEPLQAIMRRVERWYNVEVVYRDGVDINELYGGSVSRYDHVSKVLEKLELTGGIHFKIEGRKIIVMK